MKKAFQALPKWSANRANWSRVGTSTVALPLRCRSFHPLDNSQAEDLGVVDGPPREIGRHVAEGRADLQHAPRPGVWQQREHGVCINLWRVAAKRAAEITAAKAAPELGLIHGDDTGRGRWHEHGSK